MKVLLSLLIMFFLLIGVVVFINKVKKSQEIKTLEATNIVGVNPLKKTATINQNGILRVKDSHKSENAPYTNPFGTMLQGPGTTIAQEVAIAKDLGSVYYRPSSIFMADWTSKKAIVCPQCDEAQKQGLKLIITIRTDGGSQTPSTPPTDMEKYKQFVGEALNKYKPELLVVENEENSQTIFYAGTAEQYLAELKASCEVAHAKSIKCTNGGLVSSLIVLMVADNYEKTKGKAESDAYLKKALTPEKTVQLLSARNRESQITKGKSLLAGYLDAGADYVNFHWYAFPEAFTEALQYVELSSGLPALTNEVGQQNEDASQTTAIMQKIVDNRLPYAIWFSIRVNNAIPLQEANGTLNARGEAFKQFIADKF